MSKLHEEIERLNSLRKSYDALAKSVGSPVKATDAEYTAFRAHLQDEIDELLTPIEEKESNE